MLAVCRVDVLVGVMRLDSWADFSMVPGAWSVNCADWRSFGLIVGVPYSVVFLGGDRRLSPSARNTRSGRPHADYRARLS